MQIKLGNNGGNVSIDYKNGSTPDEILEYISVIESNLEKVRAKRKCVIMFVDLVGSTAFKQKNPDEKDWLPRLAIFLTSVSKYIQIHGRIVKYIGDEVMGIFENNSGILHAKQSAEQILDFCESSNKYNFEVKIALDYGDVSFLNFKENLLQNNNAILLTMGDPQGITVDRCARIMNKTPPNTALCSENFYKQSKSKSSWEFCGKFRPKGIERLVRLYRLKFGCKKDPIKITDTDISIDDCSKRVKELEEKLQDLMELRQ